MKHIRSISKITFLALLSLFKFSPAYADPSPARFINSQSQKYYLSQTTLTRYSSDGEQRIFRDSDPIYVCPIGYRILDYDLITENQTQIMGVLFVNQKSTFLEILDLHNKARIIIKNMTSYHPWKIRFVDVDRDSTSEVCLGVYKQSPLHPILAKRLFIYNFQHGLQPKWLGSRLAHPFTDFDFIIDEKKTILVTLEIDNQAQPILNAYEWDCFGFTSVQARFNTAINQAITLSPGYIFENKHYRRVLYTINQTAETEMIEID